MESFENDESDDDSRDSLTNKDSDESDFDFDYDELADDLDKLQVLSEYLNEKEMDVDFISESRMGDCGLTSISPKDVTPIPVFRNFFTDELFNLIADQTNIYAKQKNEGIVGTIPIAGRM
jgi:hypothetical protein